MMMQYFENLEKGLQAAIDQGDTSLRKLYSLEITRLGKRLYSEDQHVAWCGLTAPFDLLNAMGVTSCFVEFIGAMLAATGFVGEFIDETDQIGYSSDSCSYHRAVMGAALKGIMPEPRFLIGTTCPCSGGLAVIENLATHFGKKMRVLHIPQDASEQNVRYLAEQIRRLVSFVSEVTGRTLEPERLKTAIGYTNQTRELLAEVYEFAKTKPSPVKSKDLSNFGIVMALFLGTEAGVKLARAYRDEMQKRVQSTAAHSSHERYRLLWIQNRVQFKNPIEMLLEKEYGATVVVDELNTISWDPIAYDHVYEGLARRSISTPFNGPLATRIKHLQSQAREYQIDGAINPCNWGCRQGSGSRGLIEEGLKAVGVPVLNLEVDCIDVRKFTEGQVKTRLEAFVEMMESRKQSIQ